MVGGEHSTYRQGYTGRGVADGDTTEAWAIALPKYFLYFTMLVSGNKTKDTSELDSAQISTSASM